MKEEYRCFISALSNGRILVSSGQFGKISIWDVESRTRERQHEYTDFLQGSDFDEFGLNTCIIDLLEALGEDSQEFASASTTDKNIKIWTVTKVKFDLKGHTHNLTALKWLGNGMLASGSMDFTICIWQINRGHCLETLSSHAQSIEKLILLDHSKLASLALNEPIRIWNINFEQKTIRSTISRVKPQIFEPIGSTKLAFVQLSNNNRISLLDVVKSERSPDLISGDNDEIDTLIANGDNTLISVTASKICIWNVDTGICLPVSKEQSGQIISLKFNSNEQFITLSQDMKKENDSMKVWNIKTSQCLQTISLRFKPVFYRNLSLI